MASEKFTLPLVPSSEIDWANESTLMLLTGVASGLPEAIAELENRPELKKAVEERDNKRIMG